MASRTNCYQSIGEDLEETIKFESAKEGFPPTFPLKQHVSPFSQAIFLGRPPYNSTFPGFVGLARASQGTSFVPGVDELINETASHLGQQLIASPAGQFVEKVLGQTNIDWEFIHGPWLPHLFVCP